MKLGEKIVQIRKDNHLSQETFAELFNVTRQTVSNWENGKSHPDLETIIKMSEEFNLTMDELLKDDVTLVQQIDLEKKKKNRLVFLLLGLALVIVVTLFLFYNYQKAATAVSFDMTQHETLTLKAINEEELVIGTGYFSLVKSGRITVQATGEIDSGNLRIAIIDTETKKEVYQIEKDKIEDRQAIILEKGSYKIQIMADNYKEKIISFTYKVNVSNL